MAAVLLRNPAAHIFGVEPNCLFFCFSGFFHLFESAVSLEVQPRRICPWHWLGLRCLLFRHLLDGRLSSRHAVIFVNVDHSVSLSCRRARSGLSSGFGLCSSSRLTFPGSLSASMGTTSFHRKRSEISPCPSRHHRPPFPEACRR